MFFRNAYNYNTNAATKASAVVFTQKSRTRQADAADADINNIVERFGITKTMPIGAQPLSYGDFAEVFDFQSAQNAIVDASRRFMAMPSKIRDRFNNDPQKFLEFCTDAENADDLRKMGLANPLPKAENAVPEGDKPTT